jgi:hypothetical protein
MMKYVLKLKDHMERKVLKYGEHNRETLIEKNEEIS